MAKFFETNLQRGTQKRNLSQFDVFIEDNSRLSPEFFNISQLEDEFSLGKNAFLIRGTDKLRSGSALLVEVLDVNGDVIFTRTHDYKESKARVVSVFVYENTPTGPCTINIMGETTEDREGNSVPNRWEGKYNIRWSRKLNVNPNVYNVNRVRFIRQPDLFVDKKSLRDLELDFNKSGSDTKKSVYNSTTILPTPVGLDGRINFNASGPENSILRIDKSCGGFEPFVRGMEQGDLILRDLSNFNIIRSENRDVLNNLQFRVEQVLNETSLILKPVGENTSLNQTLELNCYQDFQINFVRNDPVSFSQLQTSTCFIQLRLRDIRTFAGTVLRAAVYARDFKTDDSYTFIGDFELPPEELILDLNTSTTPKSKRAGVFLDQNDVNTFLDPINSYSVLKNDDENLLNSVNVERDQGGNDIKNINVNTIDTDYGGASVNGEPKFWVKSHNSNPTGFTIDDNSDTIVGLKFPFLEKNGNVSLVRDTRYTLSFRYRLNNFDETAQNSTFGVFIRYKTSGESGSILEIEERLETVTVLNGRREIDELEIDFEPSRTALSGDGDNIQLVIKVLNGNWYFSDFSLIPLQRPGFSPDFTTLFFPLKKSILQELGDKIEFKVNLFDLDRNKIPVNLSTDSGVDITNCGQTGVVGGGDVISASFKFSGDFSAGKKTFIYDVAHNLRINPGQITSYSITPQTDDASAYSHSFIESDGLHIEYDTAPPTGTDNLEFKATFVI